MRKTKSRNDEEYGRNRLREHGFRVHRYNPDPVTDINFNKLVEEKRMTEDAKIRFLKALKETDVFAVDFALSKGTFSVLGDWKSHRNSSELGFVAAARYRKYYAITEASGIPFNLFIHDKNTDRLYVHMVRNPNEPNRIMKTAERLWGGKNLTKCYVIPENEIIPLNIFDWNGIANCPSELQEILKHRPILGLQKLAKITNLPLNATELQKAVDEHELDYVFKDINGGRIRVDITERAIQDMTKEYYGSRFLRPAITEKQMITSFMTADQLRDFKIKLEALELTARTRMNTQAGLSRHNRSRPLHQPKRRRTLKKSNPWLR